MRERITNMITLAVILCLFATIVVGCSQPAEPTATAVPTQQPIQIPDVQKPAGQDANAATNTPVPPQSTPSTPYPGPETTYPATTAYPAPLDAKSLLETRCTICHNLERVTTAKKDRAGWDHTVSHMITKGAILSADEAQTLIDYLAENYR